MPETEILADEHGGGVKAVDEYLADKLFGSQRGHREIEMEDEDSVKAQSFETHEALFERFDLSGREFGAQNAYRMRRKRNRCGENVRAARAFDNASENFLMAQMYAIEIADG